jgi:hypothetical protein
MKSEYERTECDSMNSNKHLSEIRKKTQDINDKFNKEKF